MNVLNIPQETTKGNMVLSDPNDFMEVFHHFIGGIYTKECHLQAGVTFAQHEHKFSHQSILASGTAVLTVDGEDFEYTGPKILNIEAHKTHAVYAVTPCVWLCQHVTDCTDPDEIDLEVIDEPLVKET